MGGGGPSDGVLGCLEWPEIGISCACHGCRFCSNFSGLHLQCLRLFCNILGMDEVMMKHNEQIV